MDMIRLCCIRITENAVARVFNTPPPDRINEYRKKNFFSTASGIASSPISNTPSYLFFQIKEIDHLAEFLF